MIGNLLRRLIAKDMMLDIKTGKRMQSITQVNNTRTKAVASSLVKHTMHTKEVTKTAMMKAIKTDLKSSASKKLII